MDWTRDTAQTAVAGLLTQYREGGHETAECSLDLIGRVDQVDDGGRVRAVLAEIVTGTTALLREKVRVWGVDGPCVVEFESTDGSPLGIDDIDPPLRAGVRALLAGLNGHAEDVADQLDLLVLGDREAVVQTAMLIMKLMVELLSWCDDASVPVPHWLARHATS